MHFIINYLLIVLVLYITCIVITALSYKGGGDNDLGSFNIYHLKIGLYINYGMWSIGILSLSQLKRYYIFPLPIVGFVIYYA